LQLLEADSKWPECVLHLPRDSASLEVHPSEWSAAICRLNGFEHPSDAEKTGKIILDSQSELSTVTRKLEEQLAKKKSKYLEALMPLICVDEAAASGHVRPDISGRDC